MTHTKGHSVIRAIAILLVVFLLFPPWLVAVSAQQAEAEILLAQATVAYEEARYEKARALLERAKTLDPQNARVFYYAGLTLLALKQPALAVAQLTIAHELRPNDLFIRFQLGVAYFALESYDRAAPLLFEVFDEQPQLDGLGFYVGFLRYRAKAYDAALKAFDVGQTADTEMQQLTRFYRGLTLGVLGLPDQALVELEEILKSEAVSPVTSGAIRLRDTLSAGRVKQEEAKRFHFQVSLGGVYDDNVAVNPDSSNNSLARQLRERSTNSPGLLASMLAEYAWLRQGPWESRVRYSFFQTLNTEGNLSRFNIQDHLGGINGFYRGIVAQLPYQLALDYTFDYLFLDQAAFLTRHTPTASVTVVPPAFKVPVLGDVGNLTSVLVRYQVKEFLREVGDDDPRFQSDIRDALNIMTGVTHAFRFAQDQHLVRIGYQYDNENAEGTNFVLFWSPFTHRWSSDVAMGGYPGTVRLRCSLA